MLVLLGKIMIDLGFWLEKIQSTLGGLPNVEGFPARHDWAQRLDPVSKYLVFLVIHIRGKGLENLM